MFGFFKKNQVEKEVPVFALAGGEIVPITQVNDPVFAGKMMGDGFAVIPASGVITSPVKGEVVNVFPTLHAVGIQTAGGLEVLVHMGIDTVELKGGPFETTVTVGQKVDENTTHKIVDDGYTVTWGIKNNLQGLWISEDGNALCAIQDNDMRESEDPVIRYMLYIPLKYAVEVNMTVNSNRMRDVNTDKTYLERNIENLRTAQ